MLGLFDFNNCFLGIGLLLYLNLNVVLFVDVIDLNVSFLFFDI